MNRYFLESIKIIDGKIFHLEYHQKRYENVLKFLNAKKIQNLQEFIKPPSVGIYKCRLVYNEESIEVSFHRYKKRVIKSLKLIYDDEIEYTHKSTSREKLDALYRQKEEGDEILIIKKSYITDTSIANIAFKTSDDEWITPRKPLLEGTTRARLLDKGVLKEADITVDELEKFSKIALLNAMIDFDILEKCDILL